MSPTSDSSPPPGTNPGPELQNLREQIEEIDRALLSQLKQRMQLVERVAQAKIHSAYPFRDQQREEVVLQRVRGLAVELGLDAHGVERIYRRLMEMSISHQQAHVRSLDSVPLRVAYQGVEGSYSHLTAQRRYAGRKGGVLLSGFATVHAAVNALRSGQADATVLPIENSTAGSINETYDELAEGGLCINAEEFSWVEHCLVGLPGATLEGLRLILSHPQALAQCDAFLRTLPWAERKAEFDTAGSAHKVREAGDPSLAAIASASAAKLFGLAVLQKNIQMQSGNATRFVEIAIEAAPCPPDVPCKTSLLMFLDHSAGALGEVLTEIGRRGIQLVKLESRPIQTDAWKYRFYLDLEAHADSAAMVSALDAIRRIASEVRILGTYPKATEARSLSSDPRPAPAGADSSD
ncbi:MAG: chorismate mutase [Thermoanaerobaculia bacterium]|nr:chorismate mutase [Thermoanaerobaculia bacterium]